MSAVPSIPYERFQKVVLERNEAREALLESQEALKWLMHHWVIEGIDGDKCFERCPFDLEKLTGIEAEQ